MLRFAAAALLLVAAPAGAVVVGTTAFGSLPVGASGFGQGTFPATADTSPAGRQAWRYTFSLPAAAHVYVNTSWLDEDDYNCKDDTFPCQGQLDDYADFTVTYGIAAVRFDLTEVGVSTRRFDPTAVFTPDGLDFGVNGEGYDQYFHDLEGYLNLRPGDYVLDFTGYGAPGGPAFPGSGGGVENLYLAAQAVPEPATWAAMLTGFVLTGVALRRRPIRRRA